MSAIETIVNPVWRFAQSQGDHLPQALASVMLNAEANLRDAAGQATDLEQRAIREAAIESFRHLSEALLQNLTKAAPETEGH